MSQLKDIYNEDFVQKLINTIKTAAPAFDRDKCRALIFQEDWPELALKQRMRRITDSLYETLPKDYTQALDILYQAAPHFTGLSGIVFPDYVEQYGTGHWEKSMKALEMFTRYSTSEFAVRPFIRLNQERMFSQLLVWAQHPDEHVRRLASEGSRPRLPWGISIPSLLSDPAPILPILERLMQDESLYVRKSVANNLNDISKTHPGLLSRIAAERFGSHPDTDWILKHAHRTLLKKGDKQALAVFGFEDTPAITLECFTLHTETVSIGGSLLFSFQIRSSGRHKVRIDYAIDYVKSRGNRSRKVFKISEAVMNNGDVKAFSKHHAFKDLTTRKHYKGIHTLSIIINGTVKASLDFSAQ
ncbi:DNA alkylation repair protein [Bacillus nakamurai]|uniref:DNA alkylation repair protein n=1 Tax=Bacillus nakamurai TaxID=1793963 RepID=UPI0020C41165|nr:DNA alkylation repair protein [Bacillus nakamurai]MCP6682361.1 DNA alkylation repair protein [Bacillus nakamurai]